MARRTTLTSLKEISDINLTPMMDLTFILLIAFIITYPLIEQGIPINLPKGKAQDLQPDSTRTISLNAAGECFLDDLPIGDSALQQELMELGAAMPDITVFVRADMALSYGRVAEVLRMLHQAQITRLALITQAEGS